MPWFHKRDEKTTNTWAVQPGVYFHTSKFKPVYVGGELDRILGQGNYKFHVGQIQEVPSCRGALLVILDRTMMTTGCAFLYRTSFPE